MASGRLVVSMRVAMMRGHSVALLQLCPSREPWLSCGGVCLEAFDPVDARLGSTRCWRCHVVRRGAVMLCAARRCLGVGVRRYEVGQGEAYPLGTIHQGKAQSSVDSFHREVRIGNFR